MICEFVYNQVGQCTNLVGNALWNTMSVEHELAKDGQFTGNEDNPEDHRRLDKIDVCFKETYELKFVPRAAVLELESSSLDVIKYIKTSPIGTMFKPYNFVFGVCGAGNNWENGHYTEKTKLINEIVKSCNCSQGFKIIHSLGGDPGSGLESLLSLKMRDDCLDRITVTFIVYLSPQVLDAVVEAHNQLLENSDEIFLIHNEAIRKTGVNAVPFPHLQFLAICQAQVFAPADGKHVKA